MMNSQQPTANTEHPMAAAMRKYWALAVGCWLLAVFIF
jgi:hypothetical protein